MRSMNNPKITIITSTYNSEKHIEQCIQSVLNQNYANLEYIVIDGGSVDGTVSIIKKYLDRISYFVSEPDKGISDAFNKGIKAATGDLIGIINSDDYMMPNVLDKIAAEYDEKYDVIRGYQTIYYPNRDSYKVESPNNKFGILPFGNVICHEAAFVTKKMYDKVGTYKVHFKYIMDLDLFVRMQKLGARHKFVDVGVLMFRSGGTSSLINTASINERKQLVLENGGSKFEAYVYVSYHKLKALIKRIVFLIHPK